MGLNIGLTDIGAMSDKDLASAIKIIVAARGLEVSEFFTNHGAVQREVHTVSTETPNTNVVVTPIPVPAAPGLDLDSAGLPWDGRIHSDKRTKVAEGTWKVKRNTPPELVESVLREQKIAMGHSDVPPPVPSPLSPPPTVIFGQSVPGVTTPYTPETYPNMNMPVPVVPAAPFVDNAVPPAIPVPTTQSVGVATGASPSNPATFERLMTVITPAFAQGLVNSDSIAKAVASVGLPSLPMLAHRPDLVSTVAIALGLTL